MSSKKSPCKSPKGSAFKAPAPPRAASTDAKSASSIQEVRQAGRACREGHANTTDVRSQKLNRWQQFLRDNLPTAMAEEGRSPTDAMKICAQRFKEQEESRVDSFDGSFSPVESRSRSSSPSGSHDRGRSRSPRDEFSVRGQKTFKVLEPPLKRRRSDEMHRNIITVAQEVNRDRQKFNWLRGNTILWEKDPTNKSRWKRIERQAGSSRTGARSDSQDEARRQKEKNESEHRAFHLELDEEWGGVSHGDLDGIRDWLRVSGAHLSAKYLYVGAQHAAAVTNAFQQTGKVPPARPDHRGQAIAHDRIAGSNDWTRAQIQELRMFVLERARQGVNTFAKDIRRKGREITGEKITRQRFQDLRQLLGVVFSKVCGDGSAKFSRRVRVQRYRFCLRRASEDRRPDHLRPIRVYTDESYCHAHHQAQNTWVLSEKAWRETVLQDAQDKLARGETADAPTNVVGMATSKGAHIEKPKSGKGGRAVIVHDLYSHPEMLSDDEKLKIQVDLAGPVPGALAIWAAHDSKGDYHGNFTNDVYLHWLDDKLIPGMIELSKKSDWRPVTLILDGASYHSAAFPTCPDFSKITFEQCNDLLNLLGVSDSDLEHVPNLQGKGRGVGVGSNKTLDGLRQFLKERLPSMPSRAEALIRRRLEEYDDGKGVPNREFWVIDFEPHYHFELQATEHGWGVVKVDVSMNPVFNMKEMMDRLQDSFERLWTVDLCRKLVRKCRLFEAEYLLADDSAFRRGGPEEDKRCEHPHCLLSVHESEASKMGAIARDKEVRRCKGQCGGAGYHRQCLFSGGMLSEEERKVAWPEGETWCDCGCGDVDDGVCTDEEEDEIVDLTESAGQKRAREEREKFDNLSAQVDFLIRSKKEMAAARKGAAGGAAKGLERSGAFQ